MQRNIIQTLATLYANVLVLTANVWIMVSMKKAPDSGIRGSGVFDILREQVNPNL
jgi:hypothetical protein